MTEDILNQNDPEEKPEEELEEEPEFNFKLHTGGMIDSNKLIKIELPKFSLKPISGNQQKIDELSPLTITLDGVESCRQVYQLAKNGFKEFKLEFFNEKKETISTWEFIGASIRTVDLGILALEPEMDKPIIHCEICFKNLIIDDITF